MIDRDERTYHRFADLRQFTQRQIAFVKLVVTQNCVDYFRNDESDIFRRRFGKRAGGGFAAIRDHHYRCLAELRFRSWISKIVFNEFFILPSFRLGFFEKIMKCPCTVVLRYKIYYPLRQPHFFS